MPYAKQNKKTENNSQTRHKPLILLETTTSTTIFSSVLLALLGKLQVQKYKDRKYSVGDITLSKRAQKEKKKREPERMREKKQEAHVIAHFTESSCSIS